MTDTASKTRECEVLVIGAGAGGTAVASRLLRQRPGTEVVILDPSTEHDYQPGWALVGGGGAMSSRQCTRERAGTLPSKAE